MADPYRTEPEEEDGAGWGGLVATAAERREEQRQERLARAATAGRAMAARLDALMQRCREDGYAPTYRDLLEVRGAS